MAHITSRLHWRALEQGWRPVNRRRVNWSGKLASSIMERRFLHVIGLAERGFRGPYQDGDGHVFDFHAFQHQFISKPATARAHPEVAQQLARHSTIMLTMDRYAHVPSPEVIGALGNLLGLPGSPRS